MEISKEIKELADFCLNCKNKNCKKGCPLDNDIPGFIMALKDDDIDKACDILSQTTIFPAVCGRVCPHEKNCEAFCVRGIKQKPVEIGKMEAFVGDYANKKGFCNKEFSAYKNKKVAVIGGGPAGLSASAYLAREGYGVTIFEQEDNLGGIMSYGIPEFRLNQEVVKSTINNILNMGIEVRTGVKFGVDFSIDDLKNEFDAVFLGVGANIPARMNIVGEDLNNVFGANDLLSRKIHPDYNDKKIIVVGGGNVAIDIARVAIKFGAKEVTIVYRRNEEQMPANKKELEFANLEGINFLFQTNIVKILGNENVESVELIKTDLVKHDGEKRLSPINIERN